jgi:hypothetical protein
LSAVSAKEVSGEVADGGVVVVMLTEVAKDGASAALGSIIWY